MKTERFLAVATATLAFVQPATRLMAEVIPPNLPAGTKYQLIFVTNDLVQATSSNVADYNAFVTAEAASILFCLLLIGTP